MKMLFNVIFMLFFLIACQSTKPVINTASQALEKVITDYQHFKEHQSPLNQDKAGDTNRLLPDLSPESLKKQHLALSAIYQKLEQIKTEKLNSDESINHAVLAYTIKNQLDNYINNEHYMPLTAESGFHVWISRINRQVSFNTEQDYRDYLARITALPSYFSQQMYWMDKGIEAGITQPKIVLQGFEESIKAFIKTDATTSTYYQPFEKMPEHFSTELKQTLQTQAKSIILNTVMPSYQKYYDYMVNRYQPNARDNIAANTLPNGDAYYLNRLQHYTTLDISVEDVHQTGLKKCVV